MVVLGGSPAKTAVVPLALHLLQKFPHSARYQITIPDDGAWLGQSLDPRSQNNRL